VTPAQAAGETDHGHQSVTSLPDLTRFYRGCDWRQTLTYYP
jgi:hypothetical protein